MALRSERRFVSKDRLQSGMLIEFTYKKISEDSVKKYMTLIIDPNKDEYLHALLIDDLTDLELVGFITKLGEFNYDPKHKANPITNLQNDEAYKRYLEMKGERRYRTFLRKNISNLRQILIGEMS